MQMHSEVDKTVRITLGLKAVKKEYLQWPNTFVYWKAKQTGDPGQMQPSSTLLTVASL